MLENYQSALSNYYSRRFKEAIAILEKGLTIRPGDGPTDVYLKRSQIYIDNPPPDNWDGVFVMTTK